jgi:hypothetical protein
MNHSLQEVLLDPTETENKATTSIIYMENSPNTIKLHINNTNKAYYGICKMSIQTLNMKLATEMLRRHSTGTI